MSFPDWQEIDGTFARVLELSGDLRNRYLEKLSEESPAIFDEVVSLLKARDAAGDFLVSSALSSINVPEEEVDPLIGSMLGSYRVKRRLASGGMGTVYLGFRSDDEYETEVAIKVIHPGRISEEGVKRFLLERQILSDLNHPNIARLLDGGRSKEGLPYYIMELIDGVTITRHCSEEGLSIRERLALFLKICDAIEFAHRNLIVHRDLKPQNILVDREGRPKILDFGIAKHLSDGASGLTTARHSQPFFTPDYASPEQVRGQRITLATDIYSLGAVLYELLSGKRPHRFSGKTPSEIEKSICETDPPPPSSQVVVQPEAGEDDATDIFWPGDLTLRELHQSLKGDLDTIVLKALRKEPERRYSTVAEMVSDVQNYLEGRPVSAHPDSLRCRVRKFVRRHRGGVAAVLVLLVTLAGALVLKTWQAQVAALERRRAETRFNQVRSLAKTCLKASEVANIERAAALQLADEAEEAFSECLEIWNNLEAEGQLHEWDLREKMVAQELLADLLRREHPGSGG